MSVSFIIDVHVADPTRDQDDIRKCVATDIHDWMKEMEEAYPGVTFEVSDA